MNKKLLIISVGGIGAVYFAYKQYQSNLVTKQNQTNANYLNTLVARSVNNTQTLASQNVASSNSNPVQTTIQQGNAITSSTVNQSIMQSADYLFNQQQITANKNTNDYTSSLANMLKNFSDAAFNSLQNPAQTTSEGGLSSVNVNNTISDGTSKVTLTADTKKVLPKFTAAPVIILPQANVSYNTNSFNTTTSTVVTQTHINIDN